MFGEDPGEPGSWQLDACEGAAGSSYCTFSDDAGNAIVVRVDNARVSMSEPRAIDEVRIGT